MSKRKPKVVEAWALVTADNLVVATSVFDAEFGSVAKGECVVRLTPADPHAKLKADVVRAAVDVAAWLDPSPGSRCGSFTLSEAHQKLRAAVSKLQKVKP